MAKILIIDDEELVCDALVQVIRPMGHDVRSALTLKEGIKEAQTNIFDIVFLDVDLPDGSGLDALEEIREAPSEPEVIIITGVGNPDGAELAIKSGAWDYVAKPLSVQVITLSITRSIEYRKEKKTRETSAALKREGIVGDSIQIRRCLDLVAQAANTEANVLITGETGSGKELFARAIHKNSWRASKNFVVVDCAALPETLVESILFGHKKGAFTGADRTQEGLIKQANEGTLFLDEVGELPLSVQRAFLRVLQEHRFRPVGGHEELASDFRLVAATNRHLDEMVQAGKFRSDLLFRLRSIVLSLPPLRNRDKDIKDLAVHYMNTFCEHYGTATKGFSPEFADLLTAYSWPGNVRELVHAVQSALSVAPNNSTLFPIHLPERIRIELTRASAANGNSNHDGLQKSTKASKEFPNIKTFIEATEQQYFKDLLSAARGDIRKACRMSGLCRSSLYGRLKKYKIHHHS